MRIFHVSEEPNIHVFYPRTPTRSDLDKNTKLVWAIEERKLHTFLTPRDCPRIAICALPTSSKTDIDTFLGGCKDTKVLALEQRWFSKILSTTLYLYEFDPSNFVLQDKIAGYYVSTQIETPIRVIKITNLFEELFKRNITVTLTPNLHTLFKTLPYSTIVYSICRIRNSFPPLDDKDIQEFYKINSTRFE